MIEKAFKILLAGGLALTLVPPQALSVFAQNEPANLALNKTATVSDHETSYWDADKAVDGILNREANKPDQSRWGTNRLKEQPAWLKVNLGEKKTFQSFVLAWERRNITGYRIQVSDTGDDNGEWRDVYIKAGTNEISDINEVIHLETPVEAQYIRLYVDGYNGNHVQGGGGQWESVSLYEFQVYEDEIPGDILPSENYNREGSATASNVEGNDQAAAGANRAIDGDEETRWTTDGNNSVPARTLTVELPVSQRIQFFRILWERPTITNYTISVSDNGTDYTEVYSKPGNDTITNRDELLKLDAPVWGKYIKLNVTGYTGGDLGWKNVSVAEFEAYAVEPNLGPDEDSTAKEVANWLKAPTINADGTAVVFPSVPNGFTIDSFSADYEQIIETDGTLHKPLTATEVKGIYKVTKASDNTTAESTEEVSVAVPGLYANAGVNEKPVVVPELAEWYGYEGAFTLTDSSRIVVSPALSDAFVKAANALAEDYLAETGKTLNVVRGDDPQAHDFYFHKDDGTNGLDEEGYIMDITDKVDISAEHETGAYWATRSILQILKLNENTLPQGITRDYPKFKVRGFMLDVARKPISMETMQSIVKEMAYYKMNDFQVHLNDNLIFMEDYPDLETAMEQSYTGFRLESDIVKGGDNGKNQADLTNKDLSYSKAEFRELIEESESMGVNIVPEFDTPGHSGAFIKVRPDLHLKQLKSNTDKKERAGEQFDLSAEHYDDSLGFVKKVWDEYLTDDMFDESMTVNIGTDEYYGDKESFRKFSDDLIEYVQASGRTVRMWGSLTGMPGNTPVRSEGVQINVWNTGWANPTTMYNQGYDLINMVDGKLYMVPAAGYYNDYLNTQSIYNSWTPNNINGTVIPAGSEQMLGSAYAIWNDQIDVRANGISELDIYDRFMKAAPTLASKNWGEGSNLSYAEMQQTVNTLGDAPSNNGYYKETAEDGTFMKYKFTNGSEQADASANDRDLTNNQNVTFVNNQLELKGNVSYIESPIKKLTTGNTLAFDIKLDEEPQAGDILFEADAEGSSEYSHDIRIMEDGTLGFTRELYDYSFGYTIPVGEKVHLEICTDGTKTTLFVDGEGFAATGKYYDEAGRLKKEGISIATLLLPLQRIGSKTNAITAAIDNVEVKEGFNVDRTALDGTQFTVSADNQYNGTGNEGPVSLAFDNNPNTFWHSNYQPYEELPATVTIDLNNTYNINKFSYLPRQSGNNGHITQYSLYYSPEETGDNWISVKEHETWVADASLKTVRFDAVTARRLKFVAEHGYGDSGKEFASAAEFTVYQKAVKTTVTLDKETAEMTVGDTLKLNATSSVAGDEFTWDSSDNTVATVNADGTVTALKAGTTYITVTTAGGTSAECLVTVKDKTEQPEIVDKSALMALIENAEGLSGNFTEASKENLAKAIDLAKAALNDQASEEQVATAYQNLADAIAGMKLVANKDALITQIELAEKILANANDYVASTIKGLDELLEKATTVNDDKNAAQSAVDEITEALTKANMKARTLADKKALQETVDNASAIDLSMYTEESGAILTTAIAKANAVLADEAATQQQVDAALADVKSGVAGLKKAVDVTPDNKPGNDATDEETNNGTGAGDDTNTSTDGNGGVGSTASPSTGDATNAGALLGLLAISGGAAVAFTKKKKEE